MTVRARKQARNVTLPAALVARAKELGLNLSGLLEDAVVKAIKEAERAQWLKDNEEAIDYANAEVARRGLFSDRWRKF